MKIEIDDDTADMVVQESLVQTYKSLKKDLKNKAHLHEDDAEIYKTVVDAIEVVARWYFVNGVFDKRVKKK